MSTNFHGLSDSALERKAAELKAEADKAVTELARRQEAKKLVANMGPIIDVLSVPQAGHGIGAYRYVRAARDGNGKPIVLFSMNTRSWTGGALVDPIATAGSGKREIEISDPAYDDGSTIHYHEGK